MSARSTQRPLPRGFSLVELLVAVAIGLVLSLAVSRVLIASQQSKFSTTSVNDINQTGAYLAYTLDRTVRSAGSGFALRRANFGCLLNASRNNTTILPRASLPVPFAGVSGNIRLAPVVVYRGASQAGSDVLAVMAGSSGFGEAAFPLVANSALSTQVLVPNTLGFRSNDLVLFADDTLNACMVQQVRANFAEAGDQTLPLEGLYTDATGNNVNLIDFSRSDGSVAMSLGRVGTPALNPPDFRLYGVDNTATLRSFDLLDINGEDASVPVVEGVLEMRAIYGIDTDGNGTQDAWASPGTAPWTAAALLNGSNASRENLARIVSLRIGLILRTTLPEKATEVVARPSLTLFSGLPGETTRSFSGSDLNFRYRTLEITVPLRNQLL